MTDRSGRYSPPTTRRAKTLQIPILPVRCDNFRIRLSGKGPCLIKSLVRDFTVGSEY